MNECPICYENLNNTFICTTPCKHTFCLRCVIDLKTHACPLCRQNLKKYMSKKLLSLNSKPINNTSNISHLHNHRANPPNLLSDENFPPLQRR